jgi:hypothetical protein
MPPAPRRDRPIATWPPSVAGEVDEHVVLVGRRDAHHAAAPGGEQDAASFEAGEQVGLHLPRHGIGFVVLGGTFGDRDRVRAGQTQAEPLGASGEMSRVSAAVEEVVDELAPSGLLSPHDEPLGVFVPFGEGVDGLLDSAENTVQVVRLGSADVAGREVSADQGAPSMPGFGGLGAQSAA